MIKKVEIFNQIGQGFFSAIYIKVNGDERKLLGKLHVKDEKFFAGGELKGNRDHLLECIDVNVVFINHRCNISDINFFERSF